MSFRTLKCIKESKVKKSTLPAKKSFNKIALIMRLSSVNETKLNWLATKV